eukprot:3193108-Lingulodinium_polyedra.AAC.1
MYSSGATSSTDSRGGIHSATSENRIEEAETAGNVVPAIKECLVLDEEMVVGTSIKPRAADFVPSIP